MDKQKIAKLLAFGVQQRHVAAAVGISESAISQMISGDADLQQAIQVKTQEFAVSRVNREIKIENIQNKLLKRIDDQADYTDNIAESCRALESLTKVQMAQHLKAGGNKEPGQKVTIILPQAANAVIGIKLDKDNDIRAINDKEMLTMDPKSVRELLDTKSKTKDNQELEALEGRVMPEALETEEEAASIDV